MAEPASGRVALFSIHPQFADAILDGTKQVEFRRTELPGDVTHVVIYATVPVQRVVGVFEVAGVERMKPARAWRRFSACGGISRGSFDRYFEGATSAYVIQVANPRRLSVPMRLTDIGPELRPPQSFQYLATDVIPGHLISNSPRRRPVAASS